MTRGSLGVVTVCCALIGAWLWAPLLPRGAVNPDTDFMRFLVDRAALLRVVDDFGEFPFRSPQLGGGAALFAHPHSAAAHPLFLLSVLLGPLDGLKAEFVAMWALAVAGMVLLSRELQLHPVAVVFAGTSMAGLPWIPHRAFGGDVPELQYLATPLLLALLLRAQSARAPLVVAGLLFATVVSVGAYRAALVLAACAVFLLLHRRRLADLGLVMGVGAVAGLLAAPHLAVTLPHLVDSHRWGKAWTQDFQQPLHLLRLLWVPPSDPSAMKAWSHYVGWPVLGLAIVGLGRRRALAPLAWVALAAWFALGEYAPVDGFALIVARLPLVSAMTAAPKQFSFFLVGGLVLLAAMGLDAATRRLSPRRSLTAALVALSVLHGVLLAQHGRTLLDSAFRSSVLRLPRGPAAERLFSRGVVVPAEPRQEFETVSIDAPARYDDIHVRIAHPVEHPAMWYTLEAGYAQPLAWDTFFEPARTVPSYRFDVAGNVLRPEPAYRGEVWEKAGRDCVLVDAMTALTLRVTSRCRGSSVAVVNQRFDPGWGDSVVDVDGLLGVQFEDAGTVSLRYVPRGLVAGFALGVLGFLSLALSARRPITPPTS